MDAVGNPSHLFFWRVLLEPQRFSEDMHIFIEDRLEIAFDTVLKC